MTDKPSLTESIETLIDTYSLLDVLTAIECICSEKADHIRVNWQADTLLARHWDSASVVAGNAARRIHSGL